MSFFELDGATVIYGGLGRSPMSPSDWSKAAFTGSSVRTGPARRRSSTRSLDFAPLSAGRVTLDGVSLEKLSANEIAAAGVARTFQHAEIFGDETVLENVMTGGFGRRRSRFLQDFLGTPGKWASEREVTAEAMAVLERFGLAHLSPLYAADLPFGILEED